METVMKFPGKEKAETGSLPLCLGCDDAHYGALIASVGQTSTQLPQSVHLSGSMTYVSGPSLIASTGHSAAQDPQLMHSSVIL
jgi:hypothetical protein